MIKQNIGILNALLRITCGLTYLAISTARMVRRPWRSGSTFMLIMASMKVAEGIVRYCPVTDVVKRTMDQQASNPNISYGSNNGNNSVENDKEIQDLAEGFMKSQSE